MVMDDVVGVTRGRNSAPSGLRSFHLVITFPADRGRDGAIDSFVKDRRQREMSSKRKRCGGGCSECNVSDDSAVNDLGTLCTQGRAGVHRGVLSQ